MTEHAVLPEPASGETLLFGPVADQAALHGLLAKVRDLGLPLLSIHRWCPEHPGVDHTAPQRSAGGEEKCS